MSSLQTYLFAFLIGGAFCLLAQILVDKTALTPARILVSYVCIGVVMGALGYFDALRDIASCGASVPLVGFGATIAKGVKNAVLEDGFLGIFKGGMGASAIGITCAIVFSLIAAIFTKGKRK